MKTIVSFFLGCSMAIPVFTQDLTLTFNATGETSGIDSVTALNMRTSESVTIPGESPLILNFTTGIPNTATPASGMVVFPNPFSDDLRVVFGLSRNQKACLTVYNMMGQPIARTVETFEPGEHEFALSVREYGTYTVVVETPDELISSKAVCLTTAGRENSLKYKGGTSGLLEKSGQQQVHNNTSGYELEYATGDIIHYTCYSGLMTTIFTDTPIESVNYEVAFFYCTDPQGRHYKTVKIGDQTWMAENLAYLPTVSPSSNGSETSPFCYVYRYEGNDTNVAKETSNFINYGVLYNWEAAVTACPEGWHLPGDDEWIVLCDFLGIYAGKKMKSINGWFSGINGDNSSGFNAVPGGIRVNIGGFNGLGGGAGFWSSTEYGSSDAFGWLLTNYFGDKMGYDHATRSFGQSVRCLKNEFAP